MANLNLSNINILKPEQFAAITTLNDNHLYFVEQKVISPMPNVWIFPSGLILQKAVRENVRIIDLHNQYKYNNNFEDPRIPMIYPMPFPNAVLRIRAHCEESGTNVPPKQEAMEWNLQALGVTQPPTLTQCWLASQRLGGGGDEIVNLVCWVEGF